MDGTLWDSSENVARSWDEVISYETDNALSVTVEDIQNVMGHTMAEIAKMLFFDLGEEGANLLMDKCCDYENEYLGRHGGVLYPKVEETLQELSRKYPLYIQGDYDSSKKAGVKFIHASYGFGTIEESVPSIREFGELPQAVYRVFE